MMKSNLISVKISKLKQTEKLHDVVASCNESSLVCLSDNVVVEEPLQLILKSYDDALGIKSSIIMTTMRTPGNDLELVKGWLNTQSFISLDDIQDIYHPSTRSDTAKPNDSGIKSTIHSTSTAAAQKVTQNLVIIKANKSYRLDPSKLTRISDITSSCGICGDTEVERLTNNCRVTPVYSLLVSLSVLNDIVAKLSKEASLFCASGGSHAAAFFQLDNNRINTKLIALREDVGRHNALDKLIGAHKLDQLQHYALLLSGRVSADLMHKVICAGIPVVIAIGAPSSIAIELAEAAGVILVGFVKQGSCNIYAGTNQLNIN
jgi:FdhD protein